MDILGVIESVYDRGDLSYLLSTYTDRNFWTLKLKKFFHHRYIDNLTDFNYNKCFTLHINLSDTSASIGTKEFDEYIMINKALYRIIIEISALAPYCIIKYLRYYIEEDEIKCECSNIPYCQEHSKYTEIINEFIVNYAIVVLSDNVLMTEVTDKSLELKEAPVSVYNCLFQDTYSYYPYSDSVEN